MQALNSCQALKAMSPADSVEGVGVDRTKAGGSRERLSRIDREQGRGGK